MSVITQTTKRGFTIVELLVVIVVIGILAAITMISYTGVTQKAIVASMQSDLDNAFRKLQLFQVEKNNYPTTINCAQPESATNTCINLNPSITYNYKTSATNPSFFCIEAVKNSNYYNVTQKGGILSGPCPVLNLDARITSSYPGTGTIWKDVSGNDNDATLTNGVTYSTNNGGYMSLDGIDDYIAVNNSASLSSNSVTISIRFYIRDAIDCDANNNWRSLFHKGSTTAGGSSGYDVVLEENRGIA